MSHSKHDTIAGQEPRAAAHLAENLAESGSLAALDGLGDAAAVVDLGRDCLLAVTQAWTQHQPALQAGAALSAVEGVLPGLRAAALRALSVREAGPAAAHRPPHSATPDDASAHGASAPARSCLRGPLGASSRWSVEIAPVAPDQVLVRLLDRREAGLALQRQLDDREQLMFSSRVLAVGEMATTLAHELKQPIGAAANLLRGLRARAARVPSSPDSSAAEEQQALQRALDQLMFASRVITRMREVTSARRPRQALVDLAALVRASVSLLDWDFHRSGARVELDFPSDGAVVRGDEVMLQQVIVNLVRNALDALRGEPVDDPCVRLSLRVADHSVTLGVHDNGCGIRADIAERLFLPFATTKPQGMGIGLAICRSFAELHQGRLSVEAQPPRGTVFWLTLPCAASQPAFATRAAATSTTRSHTSTAIPAELASAC